MKKGYKICPFCANEIKEWAIKCQYCKEFLDKSEIKKLNIKGKNGTHKGLFSELNLDYNLDIHHKEFLESCIKTGEKWKMWYWISIIWLFFILIAGIAWSTLSAESAKSLEKIFGYIWLAFYIRFFYFFIWLIKNYRIFVKSKYHVSNLKWYLLLIFYWICPIINLFKPKKILENFMNAFFMNAKKEYNKKLLKWRWITWNIFMISIYVSSFSLPIFFYWIYGVRFFFLLRLIPLISYFVNTVLLFKIVNQILWAQKYKLNILWAKILINKNEKI